MKKLSFIFLSILLILSFTSFAQQDLLFNHVQVYGSGGDMNLKDSHLDSLGSIYLTGTYRGTMNMHEANNPVIFPEATSYTNTFIKKEDINGNLLWIKKLAGTDYSQGQGITTDANGNVYITGGFRGTVDLNTDTAASQTQMVTATGNYDVFIIKLDANGNFIWAKTIGATSSDIGSAIAVTSSGVIYVAGVITGTVDMNPNPSANFTLSQSGGNGFWLKLDTNGNFIWAKKIDKTSIYHLRLDKNENLLSCGSFSQTTDFDPHPVNSEIHVVTSSTWNYSDAFVHKFDSAGNFLWVAVLSSLGANVTRGLAVDDNNNVFSVGSFRGTVDFDPGIGTSFGSSPSFKYSAFIWKLNSSGQLADIKVITNNNSTSINDIYVSEAQEVYCGGSFYGYINLDPGGSNNFIYNSSSNNYIHKMDTQGVVQQVTLLGNVYPESILVDYNNRVYNMGSFSGTKDFDPGLAVYNLTANVVGIGTNVFLQTLRPQVVNDAAIVRINVPNPCDTTQPVITLKNYGTDTLFNVQIEGSLNGQPLPNITYTTPIAPLDTVAITLSNFSFSAFSENTFSFWTNLPNNTTDLAPDNDTTYYTFTKGLAGNFTIGGTAPDFLTINDAINALELYGVCDAVTFDIRDGVYDEVISINDILGTSNTKQVTFQGQSMDSSLVVITRTIPVSSTFLFEILSSDWLNFKYLTYQSDAAGSERIMAISNSSNLSFQNCHFIGVDTIDNIANNRIITIYGETNYLNISNSHFQYGHVGIYSYYYNTYPNIRLGTTISNNIFESQARTAITLFDEQQVVINKNKITFDTTTSNDKGGIQLLTAGNDVTITQNSIINAEKFGISVSKNTNTVSVPSSPGSISNNFITINIPPPYVYSSTPSYGISFNIDDLEVVHNTVLLDVPFLTNAAALNINGDNAISKNNFLMSTGKYVLRVQNQNNLENDYNIYYNPFPNSSFNNYFDFSTWKNNSGLDSNSYFINPQVLSTNPYIYLNDTILNKATYLPNIQVDINDTPRDSIRNIGAFEFDINTVYDTLCYGDIIIVNNQPTIIDSSDIYPLLSFNNTFVDTITFLNVAVNFPSLSNITDTICHYQTYDFNGNLLTTTGVFNDTLISVNGCDSIITLSLTVQPIIEILDTNIIDMENLVLGEIHITPSGDTSTYQYSWSNGSTTQDITNLQTPGFYYLTITDFTGCQDTFSFDVGYVNTHFTHNNQLINVNLFPNPVRKNQFINLEFDAILEENINYQLINVDGKILSNGQLLNNELLHQIYAPEQAGIYHLQLISDNQILKVISFMVQ